MLLRCLSPLTLFLSEGSEADLLKRVQKSSPSAMANPLSRRKDGIGVSAV